MANNKVVFGEEVLIDLTQDTVTPYVLEEGCTAHAPSGEKIVGVMKPNKPVEVETNAEMTAISTGATEKDLGKVYLFVGEDDGVFEKDALYVIVKKGTGYGFQRYAIGGSGEAGEDLTAVLDEQSQLIAELKEKLANGGGGSQECDCIIDVTELPSEYKDVDVYVRLDESTYMTFLQLFQSEGNFTPDLTYYVVDALPTDPKVSDFDMLSVIHCYIADNIPYMYGNLGGGNTWVTVSAMMGEILGTPFPDNGFTSDITAETDAGLYVTYKQGEKPIEGAVYRKSLDECEVWLVADGETQTYSEFWANFGATIETKYHLVDTLPDTMEYQTIISDTHVIRNFYILKDTGIAYYSTDGTKENAVTLTTGMTITDKGWVDDIDSIDNTDSAQAGAYTTRSQYTAFYTYTDGKWDEYQGDVKTAMEVRKAVNNAIDPFAEFFNYSQNVIQKIIVPEGATKIGHTIIYGAGLWGITDLVFPKSLVGLYGVYNHAIVCDCPDLQTIVFKGTPTYMHNVFSDCPNIKNIYVPWVAGAVAGAPWGAPSTAIVHYNTDTSSM